MDPTNPDDNSLILLMLNDHCLFSIMRYLNLRELLVVEKVCWRFKEVTDIVYRTCQVLDFDAILRTTAATPINSFDEMFWLHEGREIVSRVGHRAHTLKITQDPFWCQPEVTQYMKLYCKNLQNIHLVLRTTNKESLRNLTAIFTQVKVAELRNCEIADKELISLLKLEQIEVLNLTESRKIWGNSLVELKKIREISLEHCFSLDPRSFKNFCEHNPQLKSLNIIGCDRLNRDSMQCIATNLINLETLVLCNQHRYIKEEDQLVLADTPKIKRLEIESSTDHREFSGRWEMDRLLQRFSIYNRLEYLHIRFLGPRDVSDFFKEAMRNFTNIKILKIGCYEKDSVFIKSILDCILMNKRINLLFDHSFELQVVA